RVQRLERELKSRTPIHKVDKGRSRPVMAWVPNKGIVEGVLVITHWLKGLGRSCDQAGSLAGKRGSLPSNTVANPRGVVKAITTQSSVAYDGPTIPPTPSRLPKVVKRETEVTKDKKLALLELTPTRMTLELANRSVAYPISVAEDVFVKVRKRPFLRTARALIDVHDVSCEEYAQEVLGFSDSSTSSNLTISDPIISSSFPSFTPFEGGDFILEEIETFLRTPNELSNLDDDHFDIEGDIALIENLLNEDPSPNLPPKKNDDLKQVDVTMTKPSIEEPPEPELKDLPSHLEYAF
nr:hypothetical protein [Tanacetum cinerariifolium]